MISVLNVDDKGRNRSGLFASGSTFGDRNNDGRWWRWHRERVLLVISLIVAQTNNSSDTDTVPRPDRFPWTIQVGRLTTEWIIHEHFSKNTEFLEEPEKWNRMGHHGLAYHLSFTATFCLISVKNRQRCNKIIISPDRSCRRCRRFLKKPNT